eukprot:255925-Alexandrium_andersonii.AAC.1
MHAGSKQDWQQEPQTLLVSTSPGSTPEGSEWPATLSSSKARNRAARSSSSKRQRKSDSSRPEAP